MTPTAVLIIAALISALDILTTRAINDIELAFAESDSRLQRIKETGRI